jgi:hypothetical protein
LRYKDSSDTVHLQGLVQQITGGNASSIDELTIFRLMPQENVLQGVRYPISLLRERTAQRRTFGERSRLGASPQLPVFGAARATRVYKEVRA